MIPLFLSQSIIPLVGHLMAELQADAKPFSKHLVLVPNNTVRHWLLLELAQMDGGLAFGLNILPLKEGLYKILQALDAPHIPTQSELALRIEQAMWQIAHEKYSAEQGLLSDYLDLETSPASLAKKLVSLSHHMAEVFETYSWQQFIPKDGFQGYIWKRLFDEENIPFWHKIGPVFKEVSLPFSLHLIGFAELHPLLLTLLSALSAKNKLTLYLLSPSPHFLGDLSHKREQAYLISKASKKKTQHNAQLSLERLFKELHPLLANWGFPLRKRDALLDHRFDCQELFWAAEHPTSTLEKLQEAIVNQTVHTHAEKHIEDDSSIQIHVAGSEWREIEILYDNLCRLLENDPSIKPHDCCVLVSNLKRYLPYIQAVFGNAQSLFYPSFSEENNPNSYFLFLKHLDGLSQHRCNSLIPLLEFSSFCQKLNLDFEKVNLIKKFTESHPFFPKTAQEIEFYQNKWVQHFLEGTIDTPHLSSFNETEVIIEWWNTASTLLEESKAFHDGTKLHFHEWLKRLDRLIDHYLEPNTQDKDDYLEWMEWREQAERLSKLCPEPVFFETVWKIIESSLIQAPSGAKPIYNALLFAELTDGYCLSKKVIATIGVGPDIPTPFQKDPLFPNNFTSTPMTKGEKERVALLFTLLSAQKTWLISYTSRALLSPKELGGSLLVQELLEHLDQNNDHFSKYAVIIHPKTPFDPAIFKTQSGSFDEVYYQAAALKTDLQRSKKVNFATPLPQGKIFISLHDLKNSTKSPLKTFFKRYQIEDYDKPQPPRAAPLIPSHGERKKIVQKAFQNSLNSHEQILLQSPSLEHSVLQQVSLDHIVEKSQELAQAAEKLELNINELYKIELHKDCLEPMALKKGWVIPALKVDLTPACQVIIYGTLPCVAKTGLVVFEKSGFTSMIQSWPASLVFSLIANELSLDANAIYFLENGIKKTLKIENALGQLKNQIGFHLISEHFLSCIDEDFIRLSKDLSTAELYDRMKKDNMSSDVNDKEPNYFSSLHFSIDEVAFWQSYVNQLYSNFW